MNLMSVTNRYKQIPTPVRASVWFAFCSFFQKGIAFITTPIFTRLLTEAEYGQYGVFNSWMSIITCIVTLSLSAGVFVQGLVKFEKERECFASSLQGLCTTLVTIWTVVYLLFHNFWNRVFSLTTVQMLAMLLMIWCSSMFSFWAIKQRTDYHYQKLVAITLMVSVARPGLGIFFVIHAEDKVTARILGIVLVELLAYSWIFFAQLKKDKTFFSGRFWKYALAFNIPLIPHYLSGTVLNSADRIMIQNLVGDSEAGLYNLAYSVSQIMAVFNSALLQTMEPWLYKKIKQKETKGISSIAYPVFIGIAAVNLMLIAVAPEIIAIFAPPSYRDATEIIPPVAMSVFFMFLYSFFATFEFYYEKTRYITIATVIGAILNVTLNAVFIPIYGYVAAGYTTLVCYIVYALFHYIFMCHLCRKKLRIQRVYDPKILLSVSILFMVTGFIMLFTYQYPIIRYAFIVGLLALFLLNRQKIMMLAVKLFQLRKEN